MEIEEIKECLKQISLSNTTNSYVAKTTVDYTENMERHIIEQNNKIKELIIENKKKQEVIDLLNEFLS